MSYFSEHYDDPKGAKGALLAVGLIAGLLLISAAVALLVFYVF